MTPKSTGEGEQEKVNRREDQDREVAEGAAMGSTRETFDEKRKRRLEIDSRPSEGRVQRPIPKRFK